MSIVQVAECNVCGYREDMSIGFAGVATPPRGWVHLERPLNLMGIVTADRYLVCSEKCVTTAYQHAMSGSHTSQAAKEEEK